MTHTPLVFISFELNSLLGMAEFSYFSLQHPKQIWADEAKLDEETGMHFALANLKKISFY